MNVDGSRWIPRIILATLLTAPQLLPVSAEELCAPGPQPGATLLIPYFEVDLDDPSGRTTLISINNADSQPVVARVTLWTNMGYATLPFDMVLKADAVQTLNLRHVLEGVFPVTGDDSGVFSRCTDPLEYEWSPDDSQVLRDWHLGVPRPNDDECYALPAGEPGLAVGYATVDAMNDCNPVHVYPGGGLVFPTPIYFEPGGTGLASNRNVLWGDVIYIDPSADSATGISALALRAATGRFGPSDQTFYSGISSWRDEREPLPSAYRTRFFHGGSFDGASDVILWLDPWRRDLDLLNGFECGDPENLRPFCGLLQLRIFDESGELVDERAIHEALPFSRRLRIGGEDLPVPVNFGFIEVRHEFDGFGGCPPHTLPDPDDLRRPLQASVTTVLRAAGRFSTAMPAVALDSLCSGQAP